MTDERAIKILSDKIKQMQRYKKPNKDLVELGRMGTTVLLCVRSKIGMEDRLKWVIS